MDERTRSLQGVDRQTEGLQGLDKQIESPRGSDTQTEEQPVKTETQKPESIGGWLILVGVGLVLTPFQVVYQLFSTYGDIFNGSTWELLTTPGSEAYDPLWAPLLLGEMAGNTLTVLYWIFLLILFFSRKRQFPKAFSLGLVAYLAFIIVDGIGANHLMDVPFWDKETIRSFVYPMIWVPYMYFSERVKATFVL